MRRFLAATVSAIVLFAAFANPLPVFATDISINGDTRTFATATVVNGVMLFPLREAFEALGFTVGWDGSTGQISLTRGDDTLLLTVGSATVTLNGTATALEAPVQIIQDGVSFMPLATVLTALGYNVETDAVAAVVDEPAQVAVEEPAIPADVVPVEMPTVDPLPGVTIETVTVEGYLGPITVQVSLQDNVPFAVEVVEHNETPPFFNMAQPATADAIVEAGTWDIYPVSGATTTSQAIIDAVRQAMEGTPVQDAVTLPAELPAEEVVEEPAEEVTEELAEEVTEEPAEEVAEEPAEEVTEESAEEVTEEPADVEEPAEEEPAEDAAPVAGGVGENGLPLATATFTPGTQTVSVPGWNESTMTVDVTFSENQILDVVLVDHHESTYGSGWAFRALPGVPDQIVVRQSTNDIDTFTGATSTRNSVIAAVEEAITLAGASPADLVPQTVDAPIPGDNFIPGFVEITVPANTMNQDGNPLAEGDARMLHSEDTDMNLRVSFGRNEFHIHSGGASTLGQGADAHGESIYEAGEIGGGTWGGWFFRQTAVHNFNDRQTTQGIDIATGATESASGIRWGLEQAITQQGGNPASLVARTTPRTQIQRNPSGEPTDPFFEPGVYTVTVEGRNGPMTVAVTFDRTTIRRIVVVEHTETPEYFDTVWGASADNILRDAIYQAQFAGLDDVDTVSGATLSSSAIIEAVRQAAQQAWID